MAITPGGRVGDASPLGTKPGGKRRLDDYVRMVAHALMRKRGFTKSHAIATAKNKIRKWKRGGPHTKASVRAGAAVSVANQARLDAGLRLSTAQSTLVDLALAEADRRAFLDFATFAGLTADELDFVPEPGDIELASPSLITAHKPYRYRHGWIPLTGREPTAHLTDAKARKTRRESARLIETAKAELAKRELTPTRRSAKRRTRVERKTARRRKRAVDALRREQSRRLVATRKINAAQQEQARRIVAGTGLRTARSGPMQTTSTGAIYRQKNPKGVMPFSALSGLFGNFTEAQQAILDLAVLEAAGRDIELAPHWKHGWIPLNEEALAVKLKIGGADRHEQRASAARFLAGHGRAVGYGKVIAADAARSAATDTSDAAHQDAAKHARDVMAKVRKFEPKITEDLKLSVAAHGGQIESLMAHPDVPGDFRFKSHSSLTRKIRDKAEAKGITHEQYAAQIGDALRYTAIFDNKDFTSKSHAFLADMEKRGYKVTSVENTFARGQGYSGVNANLKAPDGTTWELQLHTPESIKAKHLMHDDYEIYRSRHVTEPERVAAYNRMMAINRQLIRPSNFHTLGQQVHRPDKTRMHETVIAAATEDLYRRGLYQRRRGRRKLKTS